MENVRRVALCLLLNPLFMILYLALSISTLSSGSVDAAIIINQALATYSVSGQEQLYKSNQDMITTNPQGAAATIGFYRYAGGVQPDLTLNVFPASYSTSGSATGLFIQLPPPVAPGNPALNLANLKLQQTDLYHVGDPIFIVVTDMDHNIRPNLAETIIIDITSSTGDKEILRLVETGDDTGVFAGYIQSVPPGAGAVTNYDGKLAVTISSLISSHYQDAGNQSETLTVTAQVDPTGRIFNSLNGQPVDGATITLIDTTTGIPATVLGDDRASSFPATVTSGGTATDSSGRVYSFAPGTYRFPLIPPGSYRLEITPPPGYKGPSTVPDSTLQNLPGAPYALSAASRGGLFVVQTGPIVRIDLPLDPLLEGLWMEKDTAKTTAAVGDLVPFRMKVANGDTAHPAKQVVVTGRLPHGLRYIKGSLRIEAVVAADPTISADGMTLRIPLGDMAATEAQQITYVTQVTAGARSGSVLSNSALAEGTGVTSNRAVASVAIIDSFFSSRSFLMGTVTSGACGEDGIGLEGIRIYLENGTYVVSDKNGMFHFEGVTPGTHVVQLDIDSLPAGYTVIPCEENSRFAGRSYSRFVDLQGGTLWRVDFRLDKRSDESLHANTSFAAEMSLPKNEASLALDDDSGAVAVRTAPATVSLELTSALNADAIEYQVRVWGGNVPLTASQVTVQLPTGIRYKKNSSTLDEKPVADPARLGASLVYDLGATQGEWTKILHFHAAIEPSAKSGTLLTQSTLAVDAETGVKQSTPVAENVMDIVKEEKRIPVPEIRLHPHFPMLEADLGQADRAALDELSTRLSGLDIDTITVTGHSDAIPIAPRSKHRYPDNYALSMARSKSVGRYLMDRLHLPPAKLELYGRGGSRPIASNATEEGRRLNRRVEVVVKAYKHTEEIRQELVTGTSGVLQATLAEQALSGASHAAEEKTATTADAVAQTDQQPVVADTPPAAATAASSDKENCAVADVRVEATTHATQVSREGASAGNRSTVSAGSEKESEQVVVPDQSTSAASADGSDSSVSEDDEQLPEFDMAWIENVQAGREWVWPPPVYYPSMPSTHIAVKHHPADKVTVTVNGEEVSPILLEKVLKHANGSVSVSYWRGVHLLEGDNRIVAIIQPADTSQPVLLERILHVSTSPVRAEIVPELSTLTADGKNPPVIAIRMFDKDDYPIREGMTGKFAITAPYESYVGPAQTKLNDLVVKEETKYIVGKEGVALIRLNPTNRTGEVIVSLPYANNREEQYRVWLTPQKREWILVGLAEGTVGYSTVSGHMESLRASGVEDTYYEDGKVAFFAKGTIKGEWLLTMAYDSGKTGATSGPGSSLFQTINPNSYYTLYSDNSQQQYDAASARKLFLKIERSQFYTLFGDYNTGLTMTELSRYSRSLNGIKSEYQGKGYEFNVFASETGQSFTKDEIRGDGTSGLYHLSRKNIVLNSDKISIEVRDRFRSEVITSTRNLARYMDYTIDYDAGTIFFKEPIPSRDEIFNPIYIVVDYETRDVGKESLNYGGRLGVKFLDEKVKTGFTYIHEDQLVGRGDSFGLDAMWQVAAGTRLKAEVARSDTRFSGVKRDALAWLAEAEHRSPKLEGKIYYRELEHGFGLGQQAASEAGTRKAGAEATCRMSDALSINGQLYRQYNLVTGGQRDLIEGKAPYTHQNYAAPSGTAPRPATAWGTAAAETHLIK